MKNKTILITGSTDGIGLETARMLVSQGHNVLLHGRNSIKLTRIAEELNIREQYRADLSIMNEVRKLGEEIRLKHDHVDVLINNAGVFTTGGMTPDGLDLRFAVNTVAPFFLTSLLLPIMDRDSRVVNLSSAAQSTVNLEAMMGNVANISANSAYSMSKLAITMWSRYLGNELRENGPVVIAVNPASLLGSKMVKEAYGVKGGDLRIGADILCRASLSDDFAQASGKYFDNDRGIFAMPHPDALDDELVIEVVRLIERILVRTGVKK